MTGRDTAAGSPVNVNAPAIPHMIRLRGGPGRVLHAEPACDPNQHDARQGRDAHVAPVRGGIGLPTRFSEETVDRLAHDNVGEPVSLTLRRALPPVMYDFGITDIANF